MQQAHQFFHLLVNFKQQTAWCVKKSECLAVLYVAYMNPPGASIIYHNIRVCEKFATTKSQVSHYSVKQRQHCCLDLPITDCLNG
jgi:hypothetical protein